MRTITQAAEELGVSRKKIYNDISKLNIDTNKDGKNNYISDDDFNSIKEYITKRAKERTKNVLERDRNMLGNNISDREYTDFKERIKFLEEQIQIKDQQLQSKDYQINGLIKSTFNLTQALNPPLEETAVSKEEIKKSSWIKKIFKRK